ncbi:uncharacterized protein LOC135463980 [Liolophura sinensis]|uniref:uncharacterized protein LOC135463980 n=1 Tax=Liolophura sinensis TaxID=3198878 RepID=UPI003158C63A
MDALSYAVPAPDDIVICPYNKSHAIEVKRMPYHLMKCRRQHIGQDFVTCPFNANHEMPKPELRYHVSTCEDRGRIAADLLYEQKKNNSKSQVLKGCTDVPSYEYDFKIPEPTEDWESETLEYPRVGVHPSVWKNPNIIRNTVGLTKSEKKEFHKFLFQASKNGGEMPLEEEPPKPEVVVAERLCAPPSRPPALRQGLARAGVGRGIGIPGGGLDALRKQVRPGTSGADLLIGLARGKQSGGLSAPLPQHLVSSSTASSSTESQDETSGAENGHSVADTKKQQKKLQKKLRQIQALEDKQDRGEELTAAEIEKTSRREEIEKALEVLNLDE